MPVVFSFGTINLDLEVRTDGWPAPGETLRAREFLMSGGKAANVAFVAARLGVESRLFGSVGDDALADLAMRSLQDGGVDVTGVERADGRTTGVALIDVRADGNKAILLAANANAEWTSLHEESLVGAIEALPEESLVTVDLGIPHTTVLRALMAARKAGAITIVDPSPAESFTDDLHKLADYVTPNAAEAEALTGINVDSTHDACAAGRRLHNQGIGTVLVKLASGGCVLVTPEHCRHFCSAPRVAVDTTGAGDAFAGALAAGLAERQSVENAVRMAVAASAMTVMRLGAQASFPSRDELDREVGRVSVG